jgi:hypothetical protein
MFAGRAVKAAADDLSGQLGWDGRTPHGFADGSIAPEIPA